ncbi:MAG: WYL domain-containing protein [Flavobacterium sp. BFFFF2]|nr:MAG: WYL domain-containing protein [Flavobacterium sp. BFFFF2]
MAKRDFIQRYIFIINRLKSRASTFEELQGYLLRQAEITGDQLEIGKRTLQRDISDIRTLFGIHIQYNRREGVYEMVESIIEKPIERIIESYEIINALNYANNVSQKLFLERRTNQGTEHLHGLLYAIDNRLEVAFTHQSFWKEGPEIRTVHPIAIKESQNRWYLICFDVNKKAHRNFSLDRIASLKISDHKFAAYPFDVVQYYEHAFGIETYEPAQKLILNFTAFQSQYIKTLPLHASQELIYEDETNCHFSYFMHPTHDFVMEILKYGEAVTVVAPESLKLNVRARIMKMAALYQ